MLTQEHADAHLARFRDLMRTRTLAWPEALKRWLRNLSGRHPGADGDVMVKDGWEESCAAQWIAAGSPSVAQQLNNEARGESPDAWARKIIRLAHGDEECHVLVADLLREFGKRAAEKERARVESLCAARERGTRETVGTAAGLLHTTPGLSDTLVMARDALDAAMSRLHNREE